MTRSGQRRCGGYGTQGGVCVPGRVDECLHEPGSWPCACEPVCLCACVNMYVSRRLSVAASMPTSVCACVCVGIHVHMYIPDCMSIYIHSYTQHTFVADRYWQALRIRKCVGALTEMCTGCFGDLEQGTANCLWEWKG